MTSTPPAPLLVTVLLGLFLVTPAQPAEPGGDDARLLKQCEHKVLTYTCDECRYETGVVKLAPDLLAAATNGPALIRLGAATRQPVEQVIEAVGEIQVNDTATVRLTPPLAGLLRTLRVDLGASVHQGDLVAELESAELGEALGAYIKQRALTDAAQRNLDRERDLVAQKVSARVDLDEAQARFEGARAEREAAGRKLAAWGLSAADLEARTGAAATAPTLLPLRATREGTVLERPAAAGNRVQPGETILVLSDLGTVWALLDIYERDLAALLAGAARPGLPVRVETRAFPGRWFAGRLETLGVTMNETTRTLKVRAAIPNPERLLRPGMFCQARISLPGHGEALVVPRAALLEDEGAAFVFTHLRDDYYIRTPVKPGRRFSETVEILEGLRAGERVVTEGAFLLKSDILREKMGAGCAD